MKERVLISSDFQKHKTWIREFIDLGFEKVILHNVNRRQEGFIQEIGDHILPFFR